MDGPGFSPSATLALPQAMIAVMGPEAAVNAVFYNKIQERPEAERADYVRALRDEYRKDIDIEKLASELVVDAVVPGSRLREELARRMRYYAAGYEPPATRKRGVLPV
jgi:acetyl-CoA carboxylase carboxyltransferase component